MIEKLGPAWRDAAIKGLYSAAMRGVQCIVTKIIPSRTPEPTDRAVYKSGWRATPESWGARVINLTPYANIIEGGVRAENVKIGTAMIRALASWAERKGLVDKGDGMSVAWAIAKSMQKKGIFNRGGFPGLQILATLFNTPENMPTFVREEVAREVAGVTGSKAKK